MITVMHSIKGGLVAQTYAFAASNNDSGARKSRIRRSKEERKDMVESFIKKYQISNDGNFPSLNLTHKEVGGSFYTVREIVREIIQENRVLAPPKEQDQFDFLEQNPLGSISVEPEVNFSVSHGLHSETHNGSVKYHVQDENIFSSVTKFHETDASKLENERMGPEKDERSDSTGHALPNHSRRINVGEDSNSSRQSHQPKEIIAVNEADQENAHIDKPHLTDDVHINDVENIGKALEVDHDSSELGNQKVLSELRINQDLTAEKTKEFGESIHKESEVEQIVDTKTPVSNDAVQSKDVESLATSNVVVETFPLRPVVRTVTVTDDDKHVPVQSSYVSGNKNSDESLNHSSSCKSIAVNVHDRAAQLESKDYLPSREKVTSLKTEHSNTLGSKAMEHINTSSANQSSPALDRVHLETWKGTSKKLTEPEANPLLAFVKALVSAWEKLWR